MPSGSGRRTARAGPRCSGRSRRPRVADPAAAGLEGLPAGPAVGPDALQAHPGTGVRRVPDVPAAGVDADVAGSAVLVEEDQVAGADLTVAEVAQRAVLQLRGAREVLADPVEHPVGVPRA